MIDWQTISTAKKDGRKLLLFREGYNAIWSGRWHEGKTSSFFKSDIHIDGIVHAWQPTHWAEYEAPKDA